MSKYLEKKRGYKTFLAKLLQEVSFFFFFFDKIWNIDFIMVSGKVESVLYNSSYEIV